MSLTLQIFFLLKLHYKTLILLAKITYWLLTVEK